MAKKKSISLKNQVYDHDDRITDLFARTLALRDMNAKNIESIRKIIKENDERFFAYKAIIERLEILEKSLPLPKKSWIRSFFSRVK